MGTISLCVSASKDACQVKTSTKIFAPSNAAPPQNITFPITTSAGMSSPPFTFQYVSNSKYPCEVNIMRKTEILDWNAFFIGDVRPKHKKPSPLIPAAVAAATILPSIPAQAIATDRIIHAFDPLIHIIQALSYPVCFMSMAGGMLLITVGQRHRGLTMIKWSAIGYIGMQLVPGIMSIVGDVGRSMN
jgi:hypothetical protein